MESTVNALVHGDGAEGGRGEKGASSGFPGPVCFALGASECLAPPRTQSWRGLLIAGTGLQHSLPATRLSCNTSLLLYEDWRKQIIELGNGSILEDTSLVS